jgi:signal transduction histidine kinase
MRNPAVELLTRQPYPELADAVRGQSPQILERFRVMVKEVLPSADELTLNEVLDDLPNVIEDLATALESTGDSTQRFLVADAKQHGVCRFHQSYNLSELLIEYSVLRWIIIEEVASALGRMPTLEEIFALNVGLDVSNRRSVESFVAYQQREIQGHVEAQSKYLSFLSHDLRGSLNGILLTVEVLRRELGGVSALHGSLQDLDLMRRSILSTVATMDRLLHAERFRQGKVEVNLTSVNLPMVISEVVNQYSHQATEKGLDFWVDTSRCPSVISDRNLTSLILQNLVGNAVKYSKKGQIRVSSQPTDTAACRIAVADEGPGIPAEQLKEIFQPYRRGPTHGQSGDGLGLSIAHQAAILLKAKLWAESKVGVGSTFYLEFPPGE